MTYVRTPLQPTVVTLVLVVLLVAGGCGFTSENSDPDAVITFQNNTDVPLLALMPPANQTPEQRYINGFPRNRPFDPGEEITVALSPPNFSDRPVCVTRTYYFYTPNDPSTEWAPWDNASQGFDDVTLVHTIEDPCFDSLNPTVSISGN